MNTDFLDAHYRHWEDAELLFNAKHWANADHLYGFSAECGLKQLMKKFGMPIDTTTGTPSKGQDRVHVMENKKTPHGIAMNPTVAGVEKGRITRYRQQIHLATGMFFNVTLIVAISTKCVSNRIVLEPMTCMHWFTKQNQRGSLYEHF